MNKIKILHITQATIGGTLEYLKLFFAHIDRDKYEVCLACPSYGPMKEEIEKMGIKVYPLEMSREISIREDLKSFIEVKNLIKNIKPDIVHLHSSKAGILGKIAAYLNGVPCIYNAHGWAFSMNVSEKKKNVYALIEKLTSIFCNHIVNISDYEYQLAKKYKIANDKKMVTIHNGIDIDKYNNQVYKNEDTLKELNIPKDSLIVGMIARISEQKNPIEFIEIANEVCSKIDNVYFILVGDGELRDQVESLISNYKLEDKVKITGWTDDVKKYLAIFDIGILTSRWEGFGLVLAEYMAASKPIVASNVGGIPELIIDKYNGILVESDDVEKFSSSIIQITQNKELSNKYGSNGLKVVNEKFNIQNVIDKHENLYVTICNKSNTTKRKCERGI